MDSSMKKNSHLLKTKIPQNGDYRMDSFPETSTTKFLTSFEDDELQMTTFITVRRAWEEERLSTKTETKSCM